MQNQKQKKLYLQDKVAVKCEDESCQHVATKWNGDRIF